MNEDEFQTMAAESEQDRVDLAALRRGLDELLRHEDAMRVPLMVRRLVDLGVDPVVIAKTLLIGSRPGGVLYTLSSRAAALAKEEQMAEFGLWFAIRDTEAQAALLMCATGAVWLATQFSLDRALLRGFITQDWPARAAIADRRGWGALDLVLAGVASRAWLVEAIELAELPMYAPLELRLPK